MNNSHIRSDYGEWSARTVGRRMFLAGIGASVLGATVLGGMRRPGNASASGSCPGNLVNVVAHEDDDLLFLSPDLLHAIQSGRPVFTIFVTAGDAGEGSNFALSREAGSRAAYAYMASDPSPSWAQSDAGIAGHSIPVFTLASNPQISLAFLRLPDGAPNGAGTPANHYESIQKLWQGTIPRISAIDGSSSYSLADLQTTLVELINSYSPTDVHVQDFAGTYGDGDNSDHHTVAYMVQAVHDQVTSPHSFIGYLDYSIANLPANISPLEYELKERAFQIYGQFDHRVCSNATCSGSYAQAYVQRQYALENSPGLTIACPSG